MTPLRIDEAFKVRSPSTELRPCPGAACFDKLSTNGCFDKLSTNGCFDQLSTNAILGTQTLTRIGAHLTLSFALSLSKGAPTRACKFVCLNQDQDTYE